MKKCLFFLVTYVVAFSGYTQLLRTGAPQVKTTNGMLEGVDVSGVKVFKGVPFASPPTGDLRWKAPQPAKNWSGVRKAVQFGPRAMQLPLFSDMKFRSNGVSEDCLYLNIWTPAKSESDKLPVLVYFFGGGFVAGDGSELRYDGESMARNGVVAITVNFRLTVFGFFAHPELTSESPNHASGNYGLMDQSAALKWVQQNISAFGGDPKRVTIAGESAGSFSVSAQMASPLSKQLISGAIGESGSLLGSNPLMALSDAEKLGLEFADSVGARSLTELRAMPADKILQATSRRGVPRFPVTVDGYFFPKSPVEIFEAGQQAQVPLLVGWNSEESNFRSVLGQEKPTVENFKLALQKLFGERSTEAANVYQVSSDQVVEQVATDLASDRFMGFGTWKWADLQSRTTNKPVYRYMYERARPLTRIQSAKDLLAEAANDKKEVAMPSAKAGAVHSAEIEYALGNLPTNRVYDWQPDDFRVSEIMQGYFANFIKTGNPNGPGLPAWPALTKNAAAVMHIDVNTRVEPDTRRSRYLFLDKAAAK
ncbi:carboxylesterase family protein [Segetibacter sp. 3557_3]|uniref:carboxylesterase/lipase family protein n=1 Tax=Segetibacter sp. 3557_3 TaxID=2547429 RepID=UPI001058A5BD|nr:carboxylesterase family protein [Segetibacter sp. 3557_3]TDH29055.1 carboxylesterase family protein [Segetibacter sp. 3557_3]